MSLRHSAEQEEAADLARAETCLGTLLAWVGAPQAARRRAVASAVDELLSLDRAVVLTALTRVGRRVAPRQALRQRYRLTRREMDVAHLLALGKSNAEIAAALAISEHTCRHHTEHVLAKLGVRSRAAVGAYLGHIAELSRTG